MKLIPITLIFSLAMLVGCSGSTKIDQISSDVQSLNSKVDQLNNDVNLVRSDVQTVKEEAARANQRLDNQVHDYKK